MTAVSALVWSVLLVMAAASVLAACLLVRRGELRAAVWARPADVDGVVERRSTS